MIRIISKTVINLAKLLPDSIKIHILTIFVSIRARIYWFSMKKIGNDYYLIDRKKKIKVWFHIKPHIFDIYVIIGYLKKYTPKKWDIIIDWGWFHGIVWLYLAKIVGPTWKVFIFDPDPINFHELERNINLNKADNVIALQKGMRSKNSTMDFVIDWQWSSVYIHNEKKHKEKICKVELVNPVIELKKYWIENINFIKMDIEWAEVDVIEGMKEYLKDHNVNFAIAAYHILPWDTEQTAKKLEKIFHEIGYQYETWFFAHLTTYAAKRFST